MLKQRFHPKRLSLLPMLVILTILFVIAQVMVFALHSQVSNLIDSLVNASIVLQLLHPVILWPVIRFVLLQLLAYGLFIAWLWFITISASEFFKLSRVATNGLGVLLWLLGCFTLLMLNRYYFPHSFFAWHKLYFGGWDKLILLFCSSLLLMVTLLAYLNFFWFKRFRIAGIVLLLTGLFVSGFAIFDDKFMTSHHVINNNLARPNIILIGLDSLRPDFIHYYGNKTIRTPHVDSFLRTSTHFTQAFTPLARTFPAWISILTANYPKHHEARNNLVNTAMVLAQDTLPKRLRAAGYETIYATDEKRFSNITETYGFDRILGPAMGVDDFLLGGLSDFPMTNLLVNLPLGRWLFPYNYGNRAATITYMPNTFLHLLKAGLAECSNKPLFLVVHLCLSHWPHTWARDGQAPNLHYVDQYASSVQGVDKQFGRLLRLLQKEQLLDNSLIVLLSDHGTALGLQGDRIIAENQYQGDKKSLSLLQKFKLSNSKNDYTISTSYGQGTQILSLSQYHVLLAFRYKDLPQEAILQSSSLIDIAPTILDLLQLPSLSADGISLRDAILNKHDVQRSLFMETGDSISEIETDHIRVEKVLKHEIGIYRIDPQNGLLSMDDWAERGIIKNKQLAILQGDWLLAHHPARLEKKTANNKRPARSVIMPAYFVLANVKTGKWTIGLDSSFAKKAPTTLLLKQLKTFYGDELPPNK